MTGHVWPHATPTNGNADPDIAATRKQTLDVAELARWNAAQYRARHAYEDVKRRAAVAPAKSRRRQSNENQEHSCTSR